MPELSRSQAIVYGALAVALLLVGARAIRAESGAARATFAAPTGGEAGDAAGAGGGLTISGSGADVVVDVAGAVADPGVYRLPGGSRVVDALARAGGATGKAQLEAINRAARLTDGQQVVVPERGAAGATVAVGADESGPISLGSASVQELETIDGIGPVTAQKILEFRDENGGLGSVEQLDEVSGIGPATLDSMRDRLQP